MGTRYTDAPIEVHIANPLANMPLDHVDEDATYHAVYEVVLDALTQAFPQYHAAIFMDTRSYGGKTEIFNGTDDLDDDDIRIVIFEALVDAEKWVIPTEE